MLMLIVKRLGADRRDPARARRRAVPAAAGIPGRPGPRHARRQRLAGDDRRRAARARATTSRRRSSTSTTWAASLHGDLQMSLRTRRPVTHGPRRLPPGDPRAGVLRRASSRSCWASLFGLATDAQLAGRGILPVRCCWRAPPRRRSCSRSAAILLFYQQLGWLPATGRTDFTTHPTGPTGLLTVDVLAARSARRRTSTRCSTCSCRRSASRSGPRSPSAGCCARAWSARCRPTTSAPPGPRG